MRISPFWIVLLLFGYQIGVSGQQVQVVPTTISGTVTNPVMLGKNAQKVIVQVIPTPIAREQPLNVEGPVSETGSFEMTINIPITITGTLVYGRQQMPLILEPGKHLTVTFDGTKFQQSLQYSGAGAVSNTYLKNVKTVFASQGKDFNNRSQMYKDDPAGFKVYVDQLKDERCQFLNDYQLEHKTSPEFGDVASAMIDYAHGKSLLDYPFIKARSAKDKKKPQLPANYYDFLKTLTLDNPSMLPLPVYGDFLDMYISDKFAREVVDVKVGGYDFNTYYADKYDYAQQHLKGAALYYVLGRIFVDGASKGKIDYIASKYNHYMQVCPYPEYKKVATNFYNFFSRLMAGKPAPDFTVKDIDGNTVSLSDFKGKVVYLDFWATWCGPCKKELPHSKTLKTKLKGEDVVFVYLSTDKPQSQDKWKKMVADEELPGVHLFAGPSKTTISQTYNVSGIPKYIIIDKEGNLADSHAKRPSDPRTADDIRKVLKGEKLF